MCLTRFHIRTAVDRTSDPVTVERTDVETVYLLNIGCTLHTPKFVLGFRHPSFNLRINIVHAKQDSVSVVQRSYLQSSSYVQTVRVVCKATLLREQYLLQYTTTFSVPLVMKEWYSTLIRYLDVGRIKDQTWLCPEKGKGECCRGF